jgi:hypothetical protein
MVKLDGSKELEAKIEPELKLFNFSQPELDS